MNMNEILSQLITHYNGLISLEQNLNQRATSILIVTSAWTVWAVSNANWASIWAYVLLIVYGITLFNIFWTIHEPHRNHLKPNGILEHHDNPHLKEELIRFYHHASLEQREIVRTKQETYEAAMFGFIALLILSVAYVILVL